MNTKLKYLVVAVLALAVVIGVMFTLGGRPSGQPATKSDSLRTSSQREIPVTGLPGDATAAVSRDAEDETATIEAEDEGNVILSSDEQDLVEFGQSANNYDF